MKLLVAEDDSSIAEGLMYSLRAAGYAVQWARDGIEAENALELSNFDLLILDLSLPGKSGLDVLKSLRKRSASPPVLILTALDDVQNRVSGLDAGADDFLGKPFELAELAARVRALTRRGRGERSVDVVLGDLAFDRRERAARVNGIPVRLDAIEGILLESLLERAGHLVSRDQLVDRLAEAGEALDAPAIDGRLRGLHERLAKGGVRIVTVQGLGYCIESAAL